MSSILHFSSAKPSRPRRRVEALLNECGVRVNGGNPWDIRVVDEDFYVRVLRQGSLGFGESYVDRSWDVEDLEELVYRLLRAHTEERVHPGRYLLAHLDALLVNHQRRAGAFLVGRRHYDIGNDLYQCMLDSRMIYSCGYWQNARTLDEAQEAKLDLVFGKLALKPGQRVLDVGCGWGGALEYAARNYGVEGVGITISAEQASYARANCASLPIEIRLEDYRQTRERFDHIYSIGMFEHVGVKNYRTYMQTVHRCLRRGGRFLLHTIGATGEERRRHNDPWIEKYIFPHSYLPAARQITGAATGLFETAGWQEIGAHYVPTLRAWRANFERHWPQLRQTRDDAFYRMWEFYLCSSAASFRAGNNTVWQYVLEPRH